MTREQHKFLQAAINIAADRSRWPKYMKEDGWREFDESFEALLVSMGAVGLKVRANSLFAAEQVSGSAPEMTEEERRGRS